MERLTKKSPCLVAMISSSNQVVLARRPGSTSKRGVSPMLARELLRRFLMNSLIVSLGK